MDNQPSVVALSGGVGGAKLALGLSRILPQDALMVVANTGDDFEHLGLHIAPDLDTLTYVLAGIDNPQTGWGRSNETWSFMAALAELGGETWFKLGDRDLAVHVERTRRLRNGEPLSAITADLVRRLGIGARIIPMTDDRVRTRVHTDEGVLDFQDYFVRRQCAPVVTGFSFDGATGAAPHPAFLAALNQPRLRAVVICPSNPFISIDPILALPGVRAALAAAAPVIVVSPIVGRQAVKGPTAKMMRELGLGVDVVGVADHYRDIIDGYVIDDRDQGDTATLDLPILVTGTLMQTLADREALARSILDFADRLASARGERTHGSVP
ncbi:MAG: 2-phospho-L-lactate transferase [Xanthobacteraceae bacterium]